ISRDELLCRLPESWVTSYEKRHQATQTLVQTSEVSFHSRNDGTTEIKFEKPRSSSFRKQLPFKAGALQPLSFGQDGSVVYPFKDENGHQYFDVCSCTACTEEIRRRRRKKKDPLYKRYLEGDPTVGPLGDDKYDFIIQYSEKREEPQILMMQANNFPLPEDFSKDGITHSPKILMRAVLNWQTENSLAQNQLLITINQKVDQPTDGYNKRLISLQNSIMEIYGRFNNLHQEMTAMAQHMMVNTSNFRSKEAETASLKNQLKDLQRYLESMIHNQSQADTFFNPLGKPRPKPSLPGFLSSDEAFTSRYGTPSASNFKTKPTRAKPRRQKESEFLVNSTTRPTLISSLSHKSIEDSKKKEKDIGIIEFSMSNLLDTIGQTSRETAPRRQNQAPQVSSTHPIEMISHFSDTSSNSYDDSSDKESFPKQFAIGEGSTAPKREPNINEVFSSDEEMSYTRPRNQEIPPKQFT
ncbi:unnamed protein product, partial [Thlaspi arvense]